VLFDYSLPLAVVVVIVVVISSFSIVVVVIFVVVVVFVIVVVVVVSVVFEIFEHALTSPLSPCVRRLNNAIIAALATSLPIPPQLSFRHAISFHIKYL
jgi:hypothetical protein